MSSAVGESECVVCGVVCVLNKRVGYWLHIDERMGVSLPSDHEAAPDSRETKEL